MYNSVDLNSVADHVKNIFESSRCNVCDKIDGLRLRYCCGHTSCEECAQFGNCSLCLTPPGPDSSRPVVDKPLTERADSARRLLDSFQECFNFDMVKRQRLSEQLRVEKELFPQCIQAPSKYYNKRKSYQSPKANKENKSISLPGQEVSRRDSKMENSNKNVNEWLNKYVKRKPFSELDPNQTLWRNEKKKTHSNSPMFTESKAKKSFSGISKKRKSDRKLFVEKPKKSKILKNKVNDESGIVLDDYDDDEDELDEEAVIVIDDSQNVIDKDKEALLAVEQAENNLINSQSIGTTFCNSTSQDEPKNLLNEKTTDEKYTKDITKKVILNENIDVKNNIISKIPFYKKGYLTETCKYCKEATNTHSKKFVDLSLTIDSVSYTTVIKVSQIDNYLINKESVQVQTDTTENNNIAKNIADTAVKFNIKTKKSAATDIESNFDTKKLPDTAIENMINTKNTESTDTKSKTDELKVNKLPFSLNLFKGFEKEDVSKKLVNKTGNIIIEESDTDSDVDLEASISLEVTADVHRSCDKMDYNILNDVDNIEEHNKRPRRAARGNTPNSTDSSDKENYNPNRMRKTNNSTKKKSKK